jgi:uncharacterized membrane protein YfcA
MVPGILLGALASAWLAEQMTSTALGQVFGVFVLLVAVQLLLGVEPAAHRQLPGAVGLGATGSCIGLLSGLMGIGGGTLTVPFLLWNRVDIRLAVGTAATIGLPIALAGTLGFIISGLHAAVQPGFNTGFIYWPGAAAVVAASMPAAPLGARLAHSLPRTTRLLALLLIIVGVKMILGTWG